MKYDTIIFDFDGTLSDSEAGITRGFQKGLAAFGVEETLENIKALIGPPLSKTIITKYGFSPEDGAAAMKICKEYQLSDEGLSVVHLFDGVAEMLDGLKAMGLKLAIATNKPSTVAEVQFRHFGIDRWFDVTETNNADQTRGTKTDFVRWAMQRCGSQPQRCLMVGDRIHDLTGGKENGMDTAAVLYGYGSRTELEAAAPTCLAATPGELLDFILNS